MFKVLFSYVQNKELKRELRIFSVVVFVLFLVVVYLVVQNRQLNARLEVLENAFIAVSSEDSTDSEVIFPIYNDSALWEKLNSLEARINNLDSRTARFVVLPEGATDLGAALEGTIQWQGIVSKVDNNETRINEVSGQVSSVDWSVNNLAARFPYDHSNLNTWDTISLELAELRAKIVVFESMGYIEANQAVVIDTLRYVPGQMTLPGALLHPQDQELHAAGEQDVVERWLAPVREGIINFTFNNVSFQLPTKPGDEVFILESSPKVLLIQVYDPIYEEGLGFWGDLDTGEIFEGQPPEEAYTD